jgi:hypothetical protein
VPTHLMFCLLLFCVNDEATAAYEWAEAITAFVRSPWMQGRRIVGIGVVGPKSREVDLVFSLFILTLQGIRTSLRDLFCLSTGIIYTSWLLLSSRVHLVRS